MIQLFSKYFLTGGTATFVHYALMAGLVEVIGIEPGVAAALGALAGGVVSYAVNYALTFRSSEPHWAALPRFAVVVSVLAALQGWAVGSLAAQGFNYWGAQITMTVITLVLGFVLHRSFSFRYRAS